MTGYELRSLRKRAGLSRIDFALALGYPEDNFRNLSTKIRRYEAMPGRIPPPVALRARGFEADLHAKNARENRPRPATGSPARLPPPRPYFREDWED